MSLKSSDNMMIPADTVRVTKAIYPRGDNLWIKMRDELGPIFDDEQCKELFGQRGKPAESPGRPAIVTLLQFAEDLTDREAADAVHSKWAPSPSIGSKNPSLVLQESETTVGGRVMTDMASRSSMSPFKAMTVSPVYSSNAVRNAKQVAAG